MVHDLLQVLGIQGIENIEEVLAWRAFADWVFVWEVLRKLLVIGKLRPEVLHGELVVVRYCNPVYFHLLLEILVTTKHIL